MNSRHSHTPTRAQSALIHRGPQAMTRRAHTYAAPDSRAERGPPHRLRQRHDGDPLRPRKGASQPPLVGDHQGKGRRPARLRRLASVSAVHRPARRSVDRPDLRAGVRVVEEERDRHPPRHRRARARLHAPRDRHLHPALGRLRFLEPRHQAQGIRQVRHRRRHPRIVERPARAELRRVLQLQRARRSGEGVRRRAGAQVRSVGAGHGSGAAHEAQQ